MTNLCNKAAQHFHYAEPKVFTIGKSVAIWSGNIKKNKDLKSYGSAATISHDSYKQHLKEKWSNGHAVAHCSIKYHG